MTSQKELDAKELRIRPCANCNRKALTSPIIYKTKYGWVTDYLCRSCRKLHEDGIPDQGNGTPA